TAAGRGATGRGPGAFVPIDRSAERHDAVHDGGRTVFVLRIDAGEQGRGPLELARVHVRERAAYPRSPDDFVLCTGQSLDEERHAIAGEAPRIVPGAEVRDVLGLDG